jgi:ABC-type uncharacterized transport system involved in gliding motility auxiliary subunit
MKLGLTAKRRLTGFNAALALGLAAGLAVALNILAARYAWRADLGHAPYYALSATTLELLQRLPGEVRVIVFFSSQHELFPDIRRLLREYQYASPRLRVEYIDPHRDLARSKELVLRYDVAEPNVVVFAAAGGKKIVPAKDIAEYDLRPLLSGRPKVLTAFRGEQLFSSAIQGLLQAKKPVVYFLAGHGERQVASYDPVLGYSIVARNLQRENIDVKVLDLSAAAAVPKDSDLLVIAGPTRRFSRAETELLKTYLDNSGRLLVLLDAGKDAGLGELLEAWGMRLADDRVVGLTLTGRELWVANYGAHPITERLALAKVATIFNTPRSIQPLAATNRPALQAADKPRLTVLAACAENGWAELSPNQNPPKLDAGVDQPGPISVAVAVEKGLPRGMDVEIKPTRLVVVGDSSFVANGALLAQYNQDFFMNAVSWLLERSECLPIPVKTPGRIRIVMTRPQFQMAFGAIVIGIPALVGAAGLLVWWRRRR